MDLTRPTNSVPSRLARQHCDKQDIVCIEPTASNRPDLIGRTLDQNTPPELEELVDLTRPTNSVPSPSASISPVVLGSARTTPF